MFWFVGSYFVGGYLVVIRGDGEWRLEGDKVLVLGDLTMRGV